MWQEAKILRSEYVSGSGGCRNMVFRPKGAVVKTVEGEEYTTTEPAVVVGWGLEPQHDAATGRRYHMEFFAGTPSGVRAAHRYMDAYNR